MKTGLENMVRTVLMASMISMAFPFASAYAAAWEDTGNGWVYVDEAGERLTGWQQDGSQWYYLDENGLMKTGWIRDDGKWYLLDSSGAMMTGTVEDEETEYQFSDAGDLTSASKKKNEGGGTFPIGFYTEIQQEFADSLNESKQDDGEDRDKTSDRDDDSPFDYDKDKAFVIDAVLQRTAEHRLEAALANGYLNSAVTGEGTIDDYYAANLPKWKSRRHMEIYISNTYDASTAFDRLMARHSETKKKRVDRAVYYSRAGIALAEKNGRLYFMIELSR